MRVFAYLFVLLFSISSLAGEVTVLEEGKPAPYTGLLVKENRFTELVEAEIEVQELTAMLKAQRQLSSTLEHFYLDKLDEAYKPLKWYQTKEFHRWTGFVLGVAVTTAAIWGGAELIKTTR